MLKFRVLKATSILTIVLLTSQTIYLFSLWEIYYNLNSLPRLILPLTVVLLLTSHSVSVLYLFPTFYPETEVPKKLQIFFRWLTVGCWLSIIFLVLGVLGILIG